MGFKIGVIVNYNNENYIIIDVINKETSSGKITFLKIKNILNQEIFTVDSRNVKEIKLRNNKIKEENITDTGYIESLFDSVGNFEDKQESIFDLSGENTYTLDDTFLEEEIETKRLEQFSNLIQSFQKPEHNTQLTPRRKKEQIAFESSPVINETFSNLNVIGEIETTEIIPRRVLEEKKEKNFNFNNDQNNIYISRNTQNETLLSEIKNNQVLEKLEDTADFNNDILKNSNSKINIEGTNNSFKNDVNTNQIKINDLEEEKLELDMLNQKHKAIDNSVINLVQKINENSNINEEYSRKIAVNMEYEKNLTETLDSNEVEQEILRDNLKHNNRYLDSKQLDTLETGPLNTKKFMVSFTKQQSIQQNLKNNFENNNDTNTLFGLTAGFDKETLKKSKIYKKFKVMNSWLIILFTLMILTPLLNYFAKTVLVWLDENLEFSLINIFSLFKLEQFFINDILLIALSLLFMLVFLVYLIIYLILVGDKQYKKIAYYNFQLENKIEVIDSIQNYNSESSLYLIKVHNEIKKMRKEIKELKRNKISSDFLSSKKEISKVSH
ncbi:hypothetical protein [Spiroplasma taiwanense]|uniref:Transmembrane protein n=1 Tax=Spiroplasma taiwanense CT-1 TaxID=1276220 RepID=S5LTB2_9MOLU|nr:hypothetical protein [Spiroplasma taiwanense]AGR40939.1 hypothetical protein STAIW_v1c02750 [Spiroplasma taiwanense CT-1]